MRSNGQLVLWTHHELTQVFAGTSRRSTRRVVPLACPSWRSTAVNHGRSGHQSAANPQVRRLPGRGQDRSPIFQAGHAGSIPVTRSHSETPGHSTSTADLGFRRSGP